MQAYKIIDDIYRIPGGIGPSGEIYGSILLKEDNPIMIGASGENKLVNNLVDFIEETEINTELNIYFPSVTWNEIITMQKLQDKIENIKFHVHKDLLPSVKRPRDLFLKNRFSKIYQRQVGKISKKLPKKIDNIFSFDKYTKKETKTNKLMFLPFSGPHRGHSLIYSTKHKLMATGLLLGYSSSISNSYYIDQSGSLNEYFQALEFIYQSRVNIVFPAFDEPIFTSNNKIETYSINSILQNDNKQILNICSTNWKQFSSILDDYRNIYAFELNSEPYNELKIDSYILYSQLENLVNKNKLEKADNQYKRI